MHNYDPQRPLATLDRPSNGNAIVPMDATGDLINEAGYRRHLRYMAEGGTNVFVGGPHATEFVHMDEAERRRIWELSIDELKKNSPLQPVHAIILGPGSTKELVALFKLARSMGFDGAQLYPAAQDAHGNDGLFLAEAEHYFRTVLEAVPGYPLFLCGYHGGEIIDSPTKQIPYEMLVKLVDEYPHIAGVTVNFKGGVNMAETEPTIAAARLRELIAAIRDRRPVRVTGGRPYTWFDLMELGVYGFHSIIQAIAPRLCSEMCASYLKGDKPRARELSAKVNALDNLVQDRKYHYPRSTKHVLNNLGFNVGNIRQPHLPLSADLHREIGQRVKALDILSMEQTAGLLAR